MTKMTTEQQNEFDKIANDLFEQYHIEMIEQVKFLDVDVNDPANAHQIKWMAKMFAVESCEMLIHYIDPMAHYHWRNVIQSILNIGK